MEHHTSLQEIYSNMSIDTKKLLIAMANVQSNGAKKDAILHMTEIESSSLDRSMLELMRYGLIERGNYDTLARQFVVGEGERYRLTLGVADQVKQQILRM